MCITIGRGLKVMGHVVLYNRMKLFSTLFAALAAVTAAATNSTQPAVAPNGCVTFSVSAGTGCAWMCGFCASSLGTNNYYFTTDVCTYQQGAGCVGTPLAGVPYTCCAASGEADDAEEEEELEAVDEDCESEGYDDDESCEDDEDVAATDADAYDTEIVIIKIRNRRIA
jgi:hypothetical protein